MMCHNFSELILKDMYGIELGRFSYRSGKQLKLNIPFSYGVSLGSKLMLCDQNLSFISEYIMLFQLVSFIVQNSLS